MPQRQPLGADAANGIRAKLAQVTSGVDCNEALARATTFDVFKAG